MVACTGDRYQSSEGRPTTPPVQELLPDGAGPRAGESDVVMIVGGRTVARSQVWGRLGEAAGGAVIEELALDMLVESQLGKMGIRLAPGAVEAERRLLIESISRSSNVSTDEGERLLAQVRRSRGLGDERFEALLTRNAGLRALVQGQVRVTEAEVRQALAVEYGPKLRVRILVTATSGEAAGAATRLGPRVDANRFGEEAVRVSIDESAARGGLMDPFSPADTVVSAALRTAADRLAVGQMSGPIALERGFAIVYLQERLAGGTTASAEQVESMRQRVRAAQERAAMDRLARRMLTESPPTVLDRSLNWGWQNREPRP